jgi:hypothetical protein
MRERGSGALWSANDLTQECAEFVAPEYVLRRSSNCAP